MAGLILVLFPNRAAHNGLEAGLAAIIFFSIGLVVFGRILFRKSSQLIVDSKGITDTLSLTSIGFIAWEDIEHIGYRITQHAKLIYVHVRDIEKYTSRANSAAAKSLLDMNTRLYGTPICISPMVSTKKFSEIYSLIYNEVKGRNSE